MKPIRKPPPGATRTRQQCWPNVGSEHRSRSQL